MLRHGVSHSTPDAHAGWMDNVYEDPAYEETVERLKDVLLEKKSQLNDEDEKYPRLLNLRETYW